MTRCSIISCAILAFIMISYYSEGRLPALLPHLSVYQDAAKCVEVNKVWYLTYSSVPMLELPSNVSCLRFAPVAPIKNGESLSKLQFDPNDTVYVRTIYRSTNGQNAKNIIDTFHLPNGDRHRFDVYYSDCHTCKVYGFENLKNEKGCLMYIAESSLEEGNTYCHFIFDLICGPTKKFVRSDSSCLASPKLET